MRVDLAGDEAVRAAAEDLLALAARLSAAGEVTVRGLIVQPMIPPGLELIVGTTRDAQFGPLVLVGLGGVLAEALDDVSLRLAPIGPQDAAAMLDELRGSRLLDGVRGRPPIDRAAVAAILVKVAGLAASRPDIVAIDINPVIAGPAGAIAVDGLVVVR